MRAVHRRRSRFKTSRSTTRKSDMCGIAGAIGAVDGAVIEAVQRMSAAQRHRGPDSSGFWVSGPAGGGTGVVLAHRRLALIDLSAAGRQPMTDPDTGTNIIPRAG